MCRWTRSALVQACLFGTKSLPEPLLDYCQLNSWEQISMKFESEFYHFHKKKNAFEIVVCQTGSHFVQGDGLINYDQEWCHMGPLGYIELTHWPLGKFEWNFRHVIFKQILVIDGWGISCKTAPIWMSLDFTDESVNIGGGNGLVPSGNKPLPEPMLTQISVVIWDH